MRVLYIAGSGRSGSTLLARLLGQVEGVATVGELRHIWNTGAPTRSRDELCGCGEPYDRCPLWSAVSASVFPGLEAGGLDALRALARSVDRVRYLPWMLGWPSPASYRERLERYRGVLLDLYRSILAHARGKVLVDASKDPSTLFLLGTIPELEVTVVHLVRDARGVAYSWKRRKLIRPEFRDQAVYMKQHGVRQTAGFWLYCNLLAERSSRLHHRYLRLRYEDFARRPREALARICEVAGLDPPELDFIDPHSTLLRSPTHILSGNPNRFAGARIRFALDEEWRRAMPPGDRFGATLVAFPLLLRYGYLFSGGRAGRRDRNSRYLTN
ncbi:MAG: sulfotransferase [Thermoanaerobaculia bacterium]